jgi:hypothetical protein
MNKPPYRQIGDREFEGTEVLDIRKDETPKPEIESGEGHKHVQRP